MILIREECAAHVMVVEEFHGAMTVVDRENVSTLEAAPDFRDPIASLESGFRLLAFVKNDSLCREIFSDGASGKFRDVIHKSPSTNPTKISFSARLARPRDAQQRVN